MEVSICIPVYNGEKYIAKTIESAIHQTFDGAMEILIIDNMSTDDTVGIVRNFDDERIRFIQNKENIGMVGNWNECLKQARGKFIHILCADDIMECDCIREKYKLISRDKQMTMVFGASMVVDEDNNVLLRRKPLRHGGVLNGIDLARRSFKSHNLFGEPSNVMFRRSTGVKIGGYNPDIPYSPDWDFHMRLAAYGRVGYVQDCLVRYRVSSDNLTTDYLKKRKLLKKDDRELIKSVSALSELNIRQADITIHKLLILFRTMARRLFMMIRA